MLGFVVGGYCSGAIGVVVGGKTYSKSTPRSLRAIMGASIPEQSVPTVRVLDVGGSTARDPSRLGERLGVGVVVGASSGVNVLMLSGPINVLTSLVPDSPHFGDFIIFLSLLPGLQKVGRSL